MRMIMADMGKVGLLRPKIEGRVQSLFKAKMSFMGPRTEAADNDDPGQRGASGV